MDNPALLNYGECPKNRRKKNLTSILGEVADEDDEVCKPREDSEKLANNRVLSRLSLSGRVMRTVSLSSLSLCRCPLLRAGGYSS